MRIPGCKGDRAVGLLPDPAGAADPAGPTAETAPGAANRLPSRKTRANVTDRVGWRRRVESFPLRSEGVRLPPRLKPRSVPRVAPAASPRSLANSWRTYKIFARRLARRCAVLASTPLVRLY